MRKETRTNYIHVHISPRIAKKRIQEHLIVIGDKPVLHMIIAELSDS